MIQSQFASLFEIYKDKPSGSFAIACAFFQGLFHNLSVKREDILRNYENQTYDTEPNNKTANI